MHGPDFIRRICERLAVESDDVRCDELILILRTALEEDREELGSRLKFLANRYLRYSQAHREDHSGSTATRGHGLIIVLKDVSSLIRQTRSEQHPRG